MIRMLKPRIDWVPGTTGMFIKSQVVEVDIDVLILKWLKYCRTKYSLSVTDTQLAKVITDNSPETMLKEYLETH